MKLESVDLLRSAVVVIDFQKEFCHENGCIAKGGKDISLIQKMMPKVQSFLRQARQMDIPIIHVRTEHGDWTNSASWLKRG